MNRKIPYVAITSCIGQRRFWLPVLIGLLLSSNAWAAYTSCTEGDHGLSLDSCNTDDCSYATTLGTMVNETITVSGAAGDVEWEFIDTCLAGNTATTTECHGMTVTIPAASGTPTSPANPITIIGTATAGVDEPFRVVVGDEDNVCQRRYIMRVTSTGGGWGDPHITTVDGVNYDFQSAGEFISLRGDGIEVQTRQTAVSKQNTSGVNAYTGIASCLSIYTAVAARVGSHRVTIQPNISSVPDPSGLQIRVDGVLKNIGPEGIDLSPCDCASNEIEPSGRIQWAADEKSIEILYENGTKLVVTPTWWANQQKWYLNINVYDTSASEGIMGRIAAGSWLPALFDGTNVGPKAGDLHNRYVQLYETFADSWRVTAATSLFDYASGTSTANFTIDSWPRENASNCLLEGESTAEPVDEAVAEEACKDVVDANNRANCIFDVRETGHTGFAESYERTEQIIPGATQTLLAADKNSSKPGSNVTFTANVQRAVSTIGKLTSGRIQFVLDGNNVDGPVDFDNNGDAIWNTSSLQSGNHVIEAKFLPSAFGEPFRDSSSKINHEVCRFSNADGKCVTIFEKWWFWLLIILLIVFLLWQRKRILRHVSSST